jgi:hypothetical protein
LKLLGQPCNFNAAARGRVARQVSYEYGGLVVNAAILVDKDYPIVCKARRAGGRERCISHLAIVIASCKKLIDTSVLEK